MRYRGVPYPIIKTSRGYFSSGDDVAQIKSNLLAIIMTSPGERVMEPNYGCPLDQLDYRKPKEVLAENARQMIAAALKVWEKRVQVTDVLVDLPEDKNSISVSVSFIDPTNLQQTHTLTLQMPSKRRLQ